MASVLISDSPYVELTQRRYDLILLFLCSCALYLKKRARSRAECLLLC